MRNAPAANPIPASMNVSIIPEATLELVSALGAALAFLCSVEQPSTLTGIFAPVFGQMSSRLMTISASSSNVLLSMRV